MNKIRNLITILSILTFSVLVLSCDPPTIVETTGDIQGIVYDASTSQPLSGATVTTTPITSSKITDTNGGYLIEGVEPNDYTLQVVKTGYQTNTTSIKVFAGAVASADIQLSPLVPILSISTTALDFGTSSTSLPFTISNIGAQTLTWTITENSDWIAINPVSGSISTEQSSITVTVDRSNLNPGDYSESISISSNGGSATIVVSTSIEGPVLSVSTNSLNFGTSEDNLTFTIRNTGISSLSYSIINTASWLTINPMSGSAATETDVINVSANRNGLSYGNYFETITVSTNSNSESIDIMMTVSDPNNPQVSAYPTSLDFGEDETHQSLYIDNTGTGILTWNITDNQTWITTENANGTTDTEIDEIRIEINRIGLTPGEYTGTITVNTDGGNQNISVNMKVPVEPSLAISENELDFGSNTVIMTFGIDNAGTGDLSWNLTDNQDWISLNPSSGTNNSTINVSVSRTDISPGDYSGLIDISSNGGSDQVEVFMNVPIDEAPIAVVLNDPTEITKSSMKLEWSENEESDFAAYKIYKNTSPAVTQSSELLNTVTVSSANYLDVTGLLPSTTYYFCVYAMDMAENETPSNIVSATTLADELPTAVQLLDPIDITENSMTLNWTRNFDSDFSAYFVYRDTSPAITQSSELITTIINSSQNSYVDNNLTSSTTYYYRIYVMDEVEQVSASNTVSGTTITQLANWSVNATLGTTLYCVDALNENFAYTAGSSGKIYFWDGSSWTEDVTPMTQYIYDIEIISQTDVWAVGSDGISHFNGIKWEIVNNNYITKTIDIISSNDIFVGANNGKIGHYDGNTWDFITVNASDIVDIHMHNSTSGWLLDNEGKIFYYNGYGWSLQSCSYPLPSPSYNDDFSSMYVFNSSNIWTGWQGSEIYIYNGNAVGYHMGIQQWNGTGWSFITNEDFRTNYITSLSVISENAIWFVRYYPSGLIFWNGESLQEVLNPTADNLRSIHMISESDGWAVGNNGVVLRYR